MIGIVLTGLEAQWLLAAFRRKHRDWASRCWCCAAQNALATEPPRGRGSGDRYRSLHASLPIAVSNPSPWANVVGVQMTRERVPVETSFRPHPGNRAVDGIGKRTGDAVTTCALTRRRAARCNRYAAAVTLSQLRRISGAVGLVLFRPRGALSPGRSQAGGGVRGEAKCWTGRRGRRCAWGVRRRGLRIRGGEQRKTHHFSDKITTLINPSLRFRVGNVPSVHFSFSEDSCERT